MKSVIIVFSLFLLILLFGCVNKGDGVSGGGTTSSDKQGSAKDADCEIARSINGFIYVNTQTSEDFPDLKVLLYQKTLTEYLQFTVNEFDTEDEALNHFNKSNQALIEANENPNLAQRIQSIGDCRIAQLDGFCITEIGSASFRWLEKNTERSITLSGESINITTDMDPFVSKFSNCSTENMEVKKPSGELKSDCGTAEIDVRAMGDPDSEPLLCFSKALENCSEAKLTVKRTDAGEVQEETEIVLTGGEGNYCLVTIEKRISRIFKYECKYPKGTEAQNLSTSEEYCEKAE